MLIQADPYCGAPRAQLSSMAEPAHPLAIEMCSTPWLAQPYSFKMLILALEDTGVFTNMMLLNFPLRYACDRPGLHRQSSEPSDGSAHA